MPVCEGYCLRERYSGAGRSAWGLVGSLIKAGKLDQVDAARAYADAQYKAATQLKNGGLCNNRGRCGAIHEDPSST